MNNKMKISKVEFEEWREVVEEYFTKKLVKNLAQHKVYERIIRYKLEACQMNFPDLICVNPINREVSNQDEETKARPSGTT
jgi:hypothetical protein